MTMHTGLFLHLLGWATLGIPFFCGAIAGAASVPDEPDAVVVVDITGNWRDTPAYESTIRSRDPELASTEIAPDATSRRYTLATKTFVQRLNLPPGQYTLRLEYDPFMDRDDGHALGGRFEDFEGLSVAGRTLPLSFVPVAGAEEPYRAEATFAVREGEQPTELQLVLFNLRPLRTWLHAEGGLAYAGRYRGLGAPQAGQWLLAHGVPFVVRDLKSYLCGLDLTRGLDRGGLQPWHEGMRFACGDAKVKTAHFLGMIHNLDIANGTWFSPKGDHGYSHFVGDQAGTIEIEYADGDRDCIPLVFGFNLWYARPWDLIWHYNWYWGRHGSNMDKAVFAGIDAYRDVIRQGLALVDGVRLMGSSSCNARFIFSVDLEGRAVRSIAVNGVDEMYDYPLISAITLETSEEGPALAALPALAAEPHGIEPMTMDAIDRQDYLPHLERLKRLFFTYVDEVPRLHRPEVPEGYFGPAYDFRGTQEAVRAATYLYYNGPGCASFIADAGMSCTSPVFAGHILLYEEGFGLWFVPPPPLGSLTNWFGLYRQREPGALPGAGHAWTRGIGELLRESMAFGYDKFVTQYIDWLDHVLMTEANPPHWNRVAGQPEHATQRVQVGEVLEYGNRENDGHGICMWGRYMVYHWLGRPAAWNEARWEATRAAADWIQWQLDTDLLRPGVDKDVLYTESECVHGGYEFYSSYNCLHGLGLSIRMAEQLGKADVVARWTRLYQQLRQGILDNLVDPSPCGPIWHTDPKCNWQDHAHKLAHLHLATEGYTYTPLEDYAAGPEADYLAIDRNSYRFLMQDKNYDCLRMYGYGQGMMTQAALLLDEMEDAERFLKMMVDHCFLPRFARWASPEGIIRHRSGKYYLPVNGYSGQDSHIADSTKAVRIMLGVDDNDPDHLRLVPRYPESWSDMEVTDYPVLTGSRRQRLRYRYARTESGHRLEVAFEQPVTSFSVRLGPLPTGRAVSTARYRGRAVPFTPLASGDSNWVWVRNLTGSQGVVEVEFARQGEGSARD